MLNIYAKPDPEEDPQQDAKTQKEIRNVWEKENQNLKVIIDNKDKDREAMENAFATEMNKVKTEFGKLIMIKNAAIAELNEEKVQQAERYAHTLNGWNSKFATMQSRMNVELKEANKTRDAQRKILKQVHEGQLDLIFKTGRSLGEFFKLMVELLSKPKLIGLRKGGTTLEILQEIAKDPDKLSSGVEKLKSGMK